MIPEQILTLLGEPFAEEASSLCGGFEAEEIRLRAGSPLTVVTSAGERAGRLIPDERWLYGLLIRICGGSMHSYGDCIAEGWAPLPDGGRVGVCGRAVVEGDKVTGVSGVYSLNLRISHSVSGVGREICEYFASGRYSKGILICSLPGVGKTTLLRDVAATLARPPYLRRVAVIDTRSELWRADMFRGTLADRFDRYPRGAGIELAVRTMSPHCIVCDELGGSETGAVLRAQSSGVPLIASAHAKGAEGALKRRGLRELCEEGVFGCIVGLSRRGDEFSFDFHEI